MPDLKRVEGHFLIKGANVDGVSEDQPLNLEVGEKEDG